MERFILFLFLGVCFATSGCVGFDGETNPTAPNLYGLGDRYVLGSTITAFKRGSRPLEIESSNSDVARVAWDGDSFFDLEFVAAGRATITATNSVGTTHVVVEVAEHTDWEVFHSWNALLSEVWSDPLLAGDEHCFTVVYIDSVGQLVGRDFAAATFPPGVEGMSQGRDREETFCMLSNGSGPHGFDVTVNGETRSFRYSTVAPEDVVLVGLVGVDERGLQWGDRVRVDLVGYTKDLEPVRGVPGAFFADGEVATLGYFSYKYDPNESPRELSVRQTLVAAENEPRRTFHGKPELFSALELPPYPID